MRVCRALLVPDDAPTPVGDVPVGHAGLPDLRADSNVRAGS